MIEKSKIGQGEKKETDEEKEKNSEFFPKA